MRKSLLLLLFGATAFAQVNIPDANFKNRLLTSNATSNLVAMGQNGQYMAVDANGNGIIEEVEADAVYFLSVPDANISSLDGIGSFNNLIFLDASQNSLDIVDLTGLTALETLQIKYCGASEILLDGLSQLQAANLTGNDLTTLDVSSLSALEILDTYENYNLESINFGNINALTTLSIGNNPIISLDISNFVSLSQLFCVDTKITTLDMSGNPLITYMVISENENLESLNCKNNTAGTFSITNNQNLASVCVDASRVAELQEYFEEQEQEVSITTICDGPLGIIIPDENFKNLLLDSNATTLQIAGNIHEQPIAVDANADGVIEQSEADAVYFLNINNTGISSLSGIHYFKNLVSLQVIGNDLGETDLSSLANLKILIIRESGVTSLNLDGLSKLEVLMIQRNPLPALDLSSLSELLVMKSTFNELLVSVNFGDISKLRNLEMINTPIEELNLSGLVALERLKCIDTQLSALDISNNILINDIEVTDNPELISANLKNTTATVYNLSDNDALALVCIDENRVSEFQDYFEGLNQDVTVNTTCTLDSNDATPERFVMYPNPSADSINFESDSTIEYMEVYAVDGRMVEKKAINAGNATVDISALPSAAYLVKVKTEKGIEAIRLIKQ